MNRLERSNDDTMSSDSIVTYIQELEKVRDRLKVFEEIFWKTNLNKPSAYAKSSWGEVYYLVNALKIELNERAENQMKQEGGE